MKNTIMEKIYKSKGKFKPIVIDDEMRRRVKSFKDRLKEMCEYDNLPLLTQNTIRVILEELDSYDQNILISFYDFECSTSQLAKTLGVSPQTINSRIKKIQKYVANRTYMLTNNTSVSN